jgi:predicted RNA binding protein YcfA (HicA-like mRNA interferase family)
MPRDARDVAAALVNKGFCPHEGDHHFYRLFVDGKNTGIRTKISHGEREIGDNLLAQMAKQTRLVMRDFLDLIDCPLSAAGYISKLRDGGYLSRQSDDQKSTDGTMSG